VNLNNLRHFFFLSVVLIGCTGAGDGRGLTDVTGVAGGSDFTTGVTVESISAVLVVDTGLDGSSFISSATILIYHG